MPQQDEQASVLRRKVMDRLARSGMSITAAARLTHLSQTTIRNLGRAGRPSQQTLSALTALGFTMDELLAARSADDSAAAAGHEGWSAPVVRLAITATQLAPDDQNLLVALADAVMRHRTAN